MLKTSTIFLFLWAILLFFPPAFAIELIPYQVGSRYGEVIFGAKVPRPIIQEMTLITDEAAYPMTFQKIVKECEDICGGTACHYRGVYHFDEIVKGKDLVVLEGRREITNIRRVRFSAPSPLSDLGPWASKEPAQILFPPWGRVQLKKNSYGEYSLGSSLSLNGCQIQSFETFTKIKCRGRTHVDLLYEGKRLLIVSVDAYSQANVELLATLTMENREFFVFRLGLKAEQSVALLTKEGGNWKLFVRPADYPLIC